jgi:hypothetical protein
MDAKALLARMAWQLYQDIRFVTEQNPTQVVDEDGAKSYNMLLTRAKKAFPTVDIVQDFEPWNARTIKYKDALLVVGQVSSVIAALVGDEAEAQTPAPRPQTQQAPAPAPQQAAPPPRQAAPPPQQQQQQPAPAPRVQQVNTNTPYPVPSQRPAPAAFTPSQQRASHADVQRQSRGVPALNDSLDMEHGEVGPNYDSELYGPNSPPKRNDDGTIPFTLD